MRKSFLLTTLLISFFTLSSCSINKPSFPGSNDSTQNNNDNKEDDDDSEDEDDDEEDDEDNKDENDSNKDDEDIVTKTGTIVFEEYNHGQVKINSNKTEFEVGSKITLIITPDTDYEIDSVQNNGKPIIPINDVYQVTIVEGLNKIKVEFKTKEPDPVVSEYVTTSIFDLSSAQKAYYQNNTKIPYENAKVRVKGTVIGCFGKQIFLQESKMVDNCRKYAAINVYVDKADLDKSYTKVGTVLEICCTTNLDVYGNFELTNVFFALPGDEENIDNIKIIMTAEESKNDDTYAPHTNLITDSNFYNYKNLLNERLSFNNEFEVTSSGIDKNNNIYLNLLSKDISKLAFKITIPFVYKPYINNPNFEQTEEALQATFTKPEDFKNGTFKISGLLSAEFNSEIGEVIYQIIPQNNSDLQLIKIKTTVDEILNKLSDPSTSFDLNEKEADALIDNYFSKIEKYETCIDFYAKNYMSDGSFSTQYVKFDPLNKRISQKYNSSSYETLNYYYVNNNNYYSISKDSDSTKAEASISDIEFYKDYLRTSLFQQILSSTSSMDFDNNFPYSLESLIRTNIYANCKIDNYFQLLEENKLNYTVKKVKDTITLNYVYSSFTKYHDYPLTKDITLVFKNLNLASGIVKDNGLKKIEFSMNQDDTPKISHNDYLKNEINENDCFYSHKSSSFIEILPIQQIYNLPILRFNFGKDKFDNLFTENLPSSLHVKYYKDRFKREEIVDVRSLTDTNIINCLYYDIVFDESDYLLVYTQLKHKNGIYNPFNQYNYELVPIASDRSYTPNKQYKDSVYKLETLKLNSNEVNVQGNNVITLPQGKVIKADYVYGYDAKEHPMSATDRNKYLIQTLNKLYTSNILDVDSRFENSNTYRGYLGVYNANENKYCIQMQDTKTYPHEKKFNYYSEFNGTNVNVYKEDIRNNKTSKQTSSETLLDSFLNIINEDNRLVLNNKITNEEDFLKNVINLVKPSDTCEIEAFYDDTISENFYYEVDFNSPNNKKHIHLTISYWGNYFSIYSSCFDYETSYTDNKSIYIYMYERNTFYNYENLKNKVAN